MRKKWRRRIGRKSWAVATACAVLAAGGIVLLRAPGHAVTRHEVSVSPPSADGTDVQQNGDTRIAFSGPSLRGTMALSQGAVLADGVRRVLAELQISADEGETKPERAPVALAVVLDRSGSMSGAKIEQARNAVRQLVERMHDGDMVAIVAYDHEVQLVQPLIALGEDRDPVNYRIAGIQSRGGTEIPAALQFGANALSGAPGGHIRRVVLVSDGLDGSGRPIEVVSEDVRSRARAGIAVSALGVGSDYDERFLTQVADAGEGNYEFLADGSQLQTFLHRELEQASNTVVSGVVAEIGLPAGWSVATAHGAQLEPAAGRVRIPLGSMFGGGQRRVVVELDINARSPGALGAMNLDVTYQTRVDDVAHRISGGALALHAVPNDQMAEASIDPETNAYATAVVIEAQQAEAVDLWRRGEVAQAQQISTANIRRLRRAQLAAPAAARALDDVLAGAEADNDNFGSMSAGSGAGRAYGLQSNAARRTRTRLGH